MFSVSIANETARRVLEERRNKRREELNRSFELYTSRLEKTGGDRYACFIVSWQEMINR